MTTVLLCGLLLVQGESNNAGNRKEDIRDTNLAAAARSLGRALESDQKNVRVTALRTLDAMGDYARFALPQIVNHIRQNVTKDEVGSTVPLAARVLANFGHEARSITPILVSLLDSPDDSRLTRSTAADVLKKIGPAPETVPLLVDALRTGSVEARRLAVEVLFSYGATARPAIPVLINVLEDSERQLRISSAYTLAEIGSAAVPALTERFAQHLKERNAASRVGCS